MKAIINKHIVLALLFISGLCFTGLASANQTAPVGPAAYPPVGSCTSSTVPNLPPKWSANALLTPFQSQPLQVARVSVATDTQYGNMMVVTIDDVKSKGPKAWYIQGNKTYTLSNDTKGNLQCKPFTPTTPWVAPATSWLANKGCSCVGSNTVAGKSAEAWNCPNGLTEGGTPEYDWYWFTKDINKFPHRIINSRSNNTQSLPVLGDASLVNLTDVVTKNDPLLKAATAVCNQERSVKTRLKSPAIAGLSFQATHPVPPTWPNTAFANGALFAVDGSYNVMAIYYDWNTRQEVSKIKSSVDSSIQDTRLTKGITYEVSYSDRGRVCNGTLVNVGTWHPKWPHDDGCNYMATIGANSPLNPSNTRLQAMACFFGGSGSTASNIQTWYSYDGKPVMFYETNAGDLDLIDYVQWVPNATIPADVLYPISSCEGPAQVLHQCNACHGKNN